MKISIPYGSIKSVRPSISSTILLQFQFLMVRLRDLFSGKIVFLSPISIPYGSIKRSFQSHFVQLKFLISIPYGSIKSPHRRGRCRQNHISIPYGSIKSFPIFRNIISHTTFQFLMVRLRASD